MITHAKCLVCPYHLKLIKCVVSPCKECILSNRKTNPFTEKDRTSGEKNPKKNNDNI